MLTLSPAALSRSPLHVRRNYAGVLRGDVLTVRGCMIVWTDDEGSEQRRRYSPDVRIARAVGRLLLLGAMPVEFDPLAVDAAYVVETLPDGRCRLERLGRDVRDGEVQALEGGRR